MPKSLSVALFLLCCFALPARASDTCSAPPQRGFDFLIGDWIVTDRASGAFAGFDTVTATDRGCTLYERWDGQGMRGSSLNSFDPETQTWNQAWSDDSGRFAPTQGRLVDGAMVLQGAFTRQGKPFLRRVSWTPRPDRKVRQFAERSADDGKTWQVLFDFLYTPAAAAAAGAISVDTVLNQKLPSMAHANFTATELIVPPSGHAGPHRHAGFLFAYVLAGAVRSRLDNQAAPSLYLAGDSFFETPERRHLLFENPNATEAARLLIVQIAPKDAALTMAEPAPG